MKIDFFETGYGMDQRAVGPGVYMVELVKNGKEGGICLYIGESVWIASRCGVHLYSLSEDPNYFGLEREDIENEDFTLKFSVVKSIDEKKSILGCGVYKEAELNAIRNNNPLTQLSTSDRQIKDEEKKTRVQNELLKRGFKSDSK